MGSGGALPPLDLIFGRGLGPLLGIWRGTARLAYMVRLPGPLAWSAYLMR